MKDDQVINNLILSIGNFLDTFFTGEFGKNINEEVINKVQGFFEIVSAFIVIWIMYRGYQIAFGRNNANFKDFLWDAFLKLVLVTISLQYTDFITLVADGVTGIREYFTEQSLWSLLTQYAQNVTLTAAVMLDEGTGFLAIFKSDKSNIGTIAAILVIMLSLAMVVLNFFQTYGKNVISFFLLIAVFPLVLLLLIFGWFKQSFTQWLNLMLNNLIGLFLCNTILRSVLIFAERNSYFFDNAHANTSVIYICFAFIAFAFLIKMFTDLIIGLSQNLTQVSMDGVANSAVGAAIGMSASMAGVGAGAIALGARGVGQLGGKQLAELGRKGATQIVNHPIQSAKSVKNFFKRKPND